MFPIINEIFGRGGRVRITVTGSSMLPFLRENIDSVELSAIEFDDIRRGDIVLILRDTGEYILHRILRKEKNCFYMVGDAQQRIEGPLRPDQLLAFASAIWRGEYRIECSALWWRVLTIIWLIIRPLRSYIFRFYRLSKRLYFFIRR